MEKVWLKRYPTGVPAEIDADHYSSLLDIFEQSIHTFSDRTAYINMGKSITYGELGILSGQFAAYLQQGLGRKQSVQVLRPYSVLDSSLPQDFLQDLH